MNVDKFRGYTHCRDMDEETTPKPKRGPGRPRLGAELRPRGGSPGYVAASRAGKIQLAAYFDPEVVRQAGDLAETLSISRQELVARALNAARVRFGETPIFPERTEKAFRRQSSDVVPPHRKANPELPATRRGGLALAGFFDPDIVESNRALISRLEMELATFMAAGLNEVFRRHGLPPIANEAPNPRGKASPEWLKKALKKATDQT